MQPHCDSSLFHQGTEQHATGWRPWLCHSWVWKMFPTELSHYVPLALMFCSYLWRRFLLLVKLGAAPWCPISGDRLFIWAQASVTTSICFVNVPWPRNRDPYSFSVTDTCWQSVNAPQYEACHQANVGTFTVIQIITYFPCESSHDINLDSS